MRYIIEFLKHFLMSTEEIMNGIVEKVRVMFKSDFEAKVDEALKKGEEIKANFMLEDADLETIKGLIAEAVAPLVEEIAKLKGEGEAADSAAEEMKKELVEVKAAKEALEVKLAAEPAAEPTLVAPVENIKIEINTSLKATSQESLEAFYAKMYQN